MEKDKRQTKHFKSTFKDNTRTMTPIFYNAFLNLIPN
jgi:hypothetical protein